MVWKIFPSVGMMISVKAYLYLSFLKFYESVKKESKYILNHVFHSKLSNLI